MNEHIEKLKLMRAQAERNAVHHDTSVLAGGTWVGCGNSSAHDELAALDAAIKGIEALIGLMPFSVEEYYPTCATQKYKMAMERAIAASGFDYEAFDRARRAE